MVPKEKKKNEKEEGRGWRKGSRWRWVFIIVVDLAENARANLQTV